MTTIACDGKVIVTDGQGSDGNSINCGYFKKIHKLSDGRYIACCGNADDSVLFKDWLEAGEIKKDKPDVEDGFAAIAMDSVGGVKLYTRKLIPIDSDVPVFLGSGYELAMGAYEACGDIVKSVEIACKFDNNSGGVIQLSKGVDDEAF